MTEIVVNTSQKVKVVFLFKKKSIPIKLLEPVDQFSPVYALAKKGGGLNHLCSRCGNLGNKANELRKKGLRILSSPQPGEAFEGEHIAFLYGKHGLNIELIDRDKRSRLL